MLVFKRRLIFFTLTNRQRSPIFETKETKKQSGTFKVPPFTFFNQSQPLKLQVDQLWDHHCVRKLRDQACFTKKKKSNSCT